MFICPHCGEPIPDDAQVCPFCGSDDETGWNPDAEYLSVELPEEEEGNEGQPSGEGLSTPFAVFLIFTALLGFVALLGFRAVASPYGIFACLFVVVLVAWGIRRRQRRA